MTTMVDRHVRYTFLLLVIFVCDVALTMTRVEKEQLKEEAKQMFYHAYRSYINNAYPADELMPLSCKGRFRDSEPSRGDIDDALGNFSLTMVDSLDTLVILGDLEEFERAVRVIINDVSFDNDIVVSVFETNIRVLGGLLSSHVLILYLKEKFHNFVWYKGQLLEMAKDLGYRLLPAFNTSTGIPYPRINLRYGLNSPTTGNTRETCTACAGTMILEWAALSRLTGESVFEEKARLAMDYLWQQRHRASDLVGTVLNIHSGDWVRRDSGVGAGIDSYYEYCLKAYILLGYDTYLERFNKHYSAIMKYVSQGPLMVDVHMHRPHTNSRNYMDSLLAFWPGLQVLKGDIKPAIETHEMLYQVLQRHTFLPEAFTVDFQVHWGQSPLRPEFLESTYFLYKATGDNYYLEVGKTVLESLQRRARVACGFAAVKDVRTGSHEDRMDSFVLAETLKYLYLLFASREDLIIDIDDFLFTTEAHLLPLSLARLNNITSYTNINDRRLDVDGDEDFGYTCPNAVHMYTGNKEFAQSIRQPLKNLVEGVCPKSNSQRKLSAADFQPSNPEEIKILRRMGITVIALPDGRIQLLHSAAQAESMADAEEGLLFMQEMTELSHTQSQQTEKNPRVVFFAAGNPKKEVIISAGPAQFGPDLSHSTKLTGRIAFAEPLRACKPLQNPLDVAAKIGIVERGDCMFIEKGRQLQKAGAIGGIVIDNVPGTSNQNLPMFAMSGDGKDDVNIPMVFVFAEDANVLIEAFKSDPNLEVSLAESSEAAEGGQMCEIPTSLKQSLVPANPQGEANEIDPDNIETKNSEIIYLHTKENGPVTLKKIVKTESGNTVVETIEVPPPAATSATERSNSEVKDEEATNERHKEYLNTLQKLIQTALGNKKTIDSNTEQLIEQLKELMKPKKPMYPKQTAEIVHQPSSEGESTGGGDIRPDDVGNGQQEKDIIESQEEETVKVTNESSSHDEL